MKRNICLALISLGSILAGILLKDIKAVALILILAGIAGAFVLLYMTGVKHADRCPQCGCMLYHGIRMLKDKKDGMIRCPKCDILVRVEDVKDNRRSE